MLDVFAFLQKVVFRGLVLETSSKTFRIDFPGEPDQFRTDLSWHELKKFW